MTKGDFIQKAQQCEIAVREMFEYFDSALRSGDPQKDNFIGWLLREEIAKVNSREQSISGLISILFAGHETTTHMICNTVITLLSHPDQLVKIKNNPSLLENAIEECLRYVGSATKLMRVALEDIKLPSGNTVTKDSPIICVLKDMNRDPALLENPNVFDISRKSCPHFTFGRGSHICVGKSLARLELKIAVSSLFNRFPNIHLPPGYKVEWHDHLEGVLAMKNPTVILK